MFVGLYIVILWLCDQAYIVKSLDHKYPSLPLQCLQEETLSWLYSLPESGYYPTE